MVTQTIFETGVQFEPESSNSPTLTILDKGIPIFQESVPAGETLSMGSKEVGPVALLGLGAAASGPHRGALTYPVSAKLADPTADILKPGLGATFDFPTEAQLFARDPEDLGEYFDGLPLDSSEIRAQLDSWFFPYTIDPAGNPRVFNGSSPTQLLPNALSILSPRGQPVCVGASCRTTGTCGKPGCYGTFVDVTTETVDPITRETFFGAVIPDGTGALPISISDGVALSSVKAIKIQRAGGCTNEQFFADYFGTNGIVSIQQTISDGLTQLCPSVDELLVHELTIVPLVRHAPGTAGDHRGQLFVNGYVHLQGSNFGCNVRGSALYDINLDPDGALQLTPAIDPITQQEMIRVEDVDGGGCADIKFFFFFSEVYVEGAHYRVQDLFYTVLPGLISQKLLDAQSFPPPFVSTDALRKLLTFEGGDADAFSLCTPGIGPFAAPFAETVGTTLYGRGQICAGARAALCNTIRHGFVASGYKPNAIFNDDEVFARTNPGCEPDPGNSSPSVDEQRLQRIFAAVNASHAGEISVQDPRSGALKYWRCRQTDMTTDSNGLYSQLDRPGACIFVPPIKRLIFNTDSIQSVLFDSEHALAADAAAPNQEWDNASLGLWYAMVGVNKLLKKYGSAVADNSIPTDPDTGDYDITRYVCNYVPGGNTSGATQSAQVKDKKNPALNNNPPFSRPYVYLEVDRLHCPRRSQTGGDCVYKFTPGVGFDLYTPCAQYELFWEGELFAPYCPDPTKFKVGNVDTFVGVSGELYTYHCLI